MLLVNTKLAIQGLGDLTIGGAIKATIDRLQHQPQSAATLFGKARMRWDRAVVQHPPKA